jgi:pimeloyl-ACP methyl ester carboxylesterase
MTRKLDPLVEAPLSIQYIDQCGHWTQQEAPEEVNEALGKFFSTS